MEQHGWGITPKEPTLGGYTILSHFPAISSLFIDYFALATYLTAVLSHFPLI